MEQTKYKFDKITMQKIGKGCLIAMGGAGIAYLVGAVGQVDFGPSYTPLVVGLFSVLVNAVKEWLKGQEAGTIPAESIVLE